MAGILCAHVDAPACGREAAPGRSHNVRVTVNHRFSNLNTTVTSDVEIRSVLLRR